MPLLVETITLVDLRLSLEIAETAKAGALAPAFAVHIGLSTLSPARQTAPDGVLGRS